MLNVFSGHGTSRVDEEEDQGSTAQGEKEKEKGNRHIEILLIKEKHSDRYYKNVARFFTIATAQESFKSDSGGSRFRSNTKK